MIRTSCTLMQQKKWIPRTQRTESSEREHFGKNRWMPRFISVTSFSQNHRVLAFFLKLLDQICVSFFITQQRYRWNYLHRSFYVLIALIHAFHLSLLIWCVYFLRIQICFSLFLCQDLLKRRLDSGIQIVSSQTVQSMLSLYSPYIPPKVEQLNSWFDFNQPTVFHLISSVLWPRIVACIQLYTLYSENIYCACNSCCFNICIAFFVDVDE